MPSTPPSEDPLVRPQARREGSASTTRPASQGPAAPREDSTSTPRLRHRHTALLGSPLAAAAAAAVDQPQTPPRDGRQHPSIPSTRMARAEISRRAAAARATRADVPSGDRRRLSETWSFALSPLPLADAPAAGPERRSSSANRAAAAVAAVATAAASAHAAASRPRSSAQERLEAFREMRNRLNFGAGIDADGGAAATAAACVVCLEPYPQMQSLCCAQVYHVGCMFQWIKDKRRCPTCRCGMPIKPPYPPPPAHAVFAVKGCQTTRRACQRNVGVGTADEDSMTDCAMSLATTAAEGPAGEAGLGSEAQPLAAALLPSRIALPLMGAALPFVVSVALLCLLWTALDSREALTSMEVAVA